MAICLMYDNSANVTIVSIYDIPDCMFYGVCVWGGGGEGPFLFILSFFAVDTGWHIKFNGENKTT